jgi:branched-chain amino acid transport system ATP-binding protein
MHERSERSAPLSDSGAMPGPIVSAGITDVTRTPPGAAPLLETRRLTQRFGGLVAVADLNLYVRAHELLGLIGPNGAGKTTVFNLITGVYKPTEGKILFRGGPIAGMEPSRIHALGIARTFQNIRLFAGLSVLDNVRIAHHARTRYGLVPALLRTPRLRREEERVIAESLALLRTLGLEESAGEQARNLPYGQQRRLEIARALASRPRLLLLDEPAAGMNPHEIGELMEFIARIREEFDVTILLIEHQMKLVMGICERITVLDFGATIADGTPEAVRADRRVLAAYLGEPAT